MVGGRARHVAVPLYAAIHTALRETAVERQWRGGYDRNNSSISAIYLAVRKPAGGRCGASDRGVLRLGCAMLAALALSRILAQDDIWKKRKVKSEKVGSGRWPDGEMAR